MLGFLPRMPAEVTTRAAIAKLRFTPTEPTEPAALPLALDRSTAEMYEAISQPAGDLVANGRVAKFLIDRRIGGSRGVHFVNGNFVEDGADSRRRAVPLLLRPGRPRHSRVARASSTTSPTSPRTSATSPAASTRTSSTARPSRSTGCSSTRRTSSARAGIVEALSAVKAQITIPEARFAFVPTGSQQTTATVTDDLPRPRHRGAHARPDPRLDPVPAAQPRRGVGLPAHLPAGQRRAHRRPTSRVFDELPLDLSVVAGVITAPCRTPTRT